MFKNKIILALFIFALVPARTKIYGQNSSGTKDSLARKNIYQVLLDEGIDSVLLSANRSRNNTVIEKDTAFKAVPDFNLYDRHGKYDDALLQVQHIVFLQKVISSSGNQESGEYSISAKGVIFRSNDANKDFSFTRSRNYSLTYENHFSDEPKSFWNSTTIPILVTLGAVAVIALFFLVRG